ncbi:N-acetyltransferase 14 [Larimichthys crocea]|uniref:N-acetyltransferase 14 n=1 Tax=Larimichthys crocea TaxID=215358 RepID=A0A6G0IBP5_LARCR|nr:N-acetyltransferase 14 [Larimichthys crocea]
MVRLELDQVVMRRMKEDDIEVVKALIKEGCEGTENRLILHILTRPLCLFILAVFSSILRCLVHSFILALAIPVFLLIVFLKITMPRSTGVLGSSRPYWDYVGSSYRGTQDETLQNPYCRISGKTPVTRKPRRRIGPKEKDKETSTEKVTPEREQSAGQVWVADCEGDIIGCIFRDSERTSRHKQDLQVGDRLLVSQGGPGPAVGPESGTEREGEWRAQSVRTRPLPLQGGGGLLQEAWLSATWGGG